MIRPRPRLPFRQVEKTTGKQVKKKPAGDREDGRWKKGNRGRPKGCKNKNVTVTVKVKPVLNSKNKVTHNNSAMITREQRTGRPKGSRNQSTILREAIRKAGPGLVKKLLEIAKAGDVPALKAVLAPLLPKGNVVPWKFGALDTADAITQESERVLRAMEDGTLTVDEAKAVQDLLDKHLARTHTAGNRRSEFEAEELALSLIRSDERCRWLAMALCARFDQLEAQALESGKLLAATSHPLIEVARAGVDMTKTPRDHEALKI